MRIVTVILIFLFFSCSEDSTENIKYDYSETILGLWILETGKMIPAFRFKIENKVDVLVTNPNLPFPQNQDPTQLVVGLRLQYSLNQNEIIFKFPEDDLGYTIEINQNKLIFTELDGQEYPEGTTFPITFKFYN